MTFFRTLFFNLRLALLLVTEDEADRGEYTDIDFTKTCLWSIYKRIRSRLWSRAMKLASRIMVAISIIFIYFGQITLYVVTRYCQIVLNAFILILRLVHSHKQAAAPVVVTSKKVLKIVKEEVTRADAEFSACLQNCFPDEPSTFNMQHYVSINKMDLKTRLNLAFLILKRDEARRIVNTFQVTWWIRMQTPICFLIFLLSVISVILHYYVDSESLQFVMTILQTLIQLAKEAIDFGQMRRDLYREKLQRLNDLLADYDTLPSIGRHYDDASTFHPIGACLTYVVPNTQNSETSPFDLLPEIFLPTTAPQ